MKEKGSRPQGPNITFVSTETSSTIDSFLAKFLTQPQDREYADLCMLPELTEQTLLDNLRDRFNSGHIYTYIGPILVAVNPFNFFPIYNPKYARLYSQSRRLGALPPHIFAIADITYHNMLRIKESQCVVISGESGSGKTESTNFLLHHLTTLSQKGSDGSSVEQTLLSAGPVLEAFGNAVTVQNNNSSRFGKFIKVNYRENGMVSGANVEIYLLEKSRIISQAVGERNYHVFYYLLEGATDEDRKKHFLLQPNDYHYLNQNNFFSCEGINEKYEYDRLKHSMEAVGFSKDSQDKIFGMISAVLLLGNIEFIKRPGYHSDENAYIGNEELIDVIAELLNIKAQQLHQALTMRRTVLRNDTVITRYNVSEAVFNKNAMSKCLYNALFHWIVLRMNQALIKRDTAIRKKGYYIGILDIFGFEDVGAEWNSFEQLCINYANEHLQAYFNQHIFQFEQEEYLKENITWTNIEYTDNTECVHLFQQKPYGLLRLIDEESNINNATDQSMLLKLNTYLSNNEYYEIPHKKEDAFIIAHYAGKVKYQIAGFREKNKDLMRHDVMMVLKNSKSAFVRELVGDDPIAIYRWNLVRNTFKAVNAFKKSIQSRRIRRAESVDRLMVPNEPLNASHKRGSDSHLSAFLRGEISEAIVPDFCDTSVFKTIVTRAKKPQTKQKPERQPTLRSLQAVKEIIGKKPLSNKPSSVSRQFEYSLSRLMKTLSSATPYFIRCIKSNNEKIPNFFDDNIILRQLRYTGMLETVRIRRAGYSVRIEYEQFINQYRILLPNGQNSTRKDVEEYISKHPYIDANNVQYGRTKIFLRDAEKLLLDDHLHRIIMQHIHTLQHWFRSVLARRKYLKLRAGIINLQALSRGMLVRNRIRQRMDAALCIQTYFRRHIAQKKYRLIMDTITRIQAIAKGRIVREKYELLKAANELPCFYQGSDVQTVLVLPSSGSFTESEFTETEPEDEDDEVSDEETTQQPIGAESEDDEDEEG
uniref:Myosin motor domain-containing protein n=1 Tax=Panagrolaimus davidi TaxID=227884 RepID=A0A914PHG0_9BILA